MFSKNKFLKESIFCFVFFLFIYILTARAEIRISDEIAVFGVGISLATNQSLTIDDLSIVEEEINIGQYGRDGHLYAKYTPGNMITTAFLYKVFAQKNDISYIIDKGLYKLPIQLGQSLIGAKIAMLGNAFFGALGMAALFLVLRHFFDLKTSILTVLLVGMSTDWWYQSRGYLSEVGAGSFMIVSLYFAITSSPYMSGAGLGFSMFFRPTNILALPIWIKSFWSEEFKNYLLNIKTHSFKHHLLIAKKTYLSGIVIFLFIILLLFYNWYRFESFLDFGYGGESFSTPLVKGLLGILFSPICSIFLYSPILILSIPGLILFFKKQKDLAIFVCLTSFSYILTIAKWNSWEGGFAWGERLLTPIIPLLGFMVAPVIEIAWKNRNDFIIIFILALFGLSIQISVIANDPFWVMVNTLKNNPSAWEEAYHSLNKSWIALQFKSLENWRMCEIDAWIMRSLLGCGK